MLCSVFLALLSPIFSGAHTIECSTGKNVMISFSNFTDDGKVKTYAGNEYHVPEDMLAHEQYQSSDVQFHSLYKYWETSSTFFDMKHFLYKERAHFKQEARSTVASLFLHNLPLQGEGTRQTQSAIGILSQRGGEVIGARIQNKRLNLS